MPSAPIPIQTALLILTPIRSNRCAQLLRRHSPQGGTPTLRHGACFSTHQHTPTHTRAPSPQHAPHAPCIPLAAHRRNRHTQPARLHPPQTDTPRSCTAHASSRTSTHQHTPAPPSTPSLQHVPHAQCCPKSRLPGASQTPPPQQRYPATHTTRAPRGPNTSQTRLRLGPARRAAQPQRPKPQPYGHKKRSDLSI